MAEGAGKEERVDKDEFEYVVIEDACVEEEWTKVGAACETVDGRMRPISNETKITAVGGYVDGLDERKVAKAFEDVG